MAAPIKIPRASQEPEITHLVFNLTSLQKMGCHKTFLKVGQSKIISEQISEQKILMCFFSHNMPNWYKLTENILYRKTRRYIELLNGMQLQLKYVLIITYNKAAVDPNKNVFLIMAAIQNLLFECLLICMRNKMNCELMITYDTPAYMLNVRGVAKYKMKCRHNLWREVWGPLKAPSRSSAEPWWGVQGGKAPQRKTILSINRCTNGEI